MAQAYSDDLRRKVLTAYAAGKGTMQALAVRFDVSVALCAKSRRLNGGAAPLSAPHSVAL